MKSEKWADIFAVVAAVLAGVLCTLETLAEFDDEKPKSSKMRVVVNNVRKKNKPKPS